MGKKNFNKGIDNVFRATDSGEAGDVGNGTDGTLGTIGTQEVAPELAAFGKEDGAVVSYNIRYPKDMQKRIKRFCIEHDGIDMRDVFLRGAEMYMEGKKI